MRGVSLELRPTLDGALPQLVLTADDLDVAAGALVDGQGQAVVALLGDHPVFHVLEPVELAPQAELGYPADLPGYVGDAVPQLVHGDEPLVHQAENELAVAAPADGVAVRVVFDTVEYPLAAQVVEDGLGDLTHVPAGEPVVALQEVAALV